MDNSTSFVARYNAAKRQLDEYRGRRSQFDSQWATSTSELIADLDKFKATVLACEDEGLREEFLSLIPDGINAESLRSEETIKKVRDALKRARDLCERRGNEALGE